jgi:hypothetical protein
MTPTRFSAGSAPRTLRKPKAKLRAAVKSSPTGPRAARREAVPLDGRAQRSYTNHPGPASTPRIRLVNPGRSIKESETPHQVIAEARICGRLSAIGHTNRLCAQSAGDPITGASG